MKNKLSIFILILVQLYSFVAVGKTNNIQAKIQAKLINNTRELLKIQNWEESYKSEREKDIKFLLGSIGNDSLNNLTANQKVEVIEIMQKFAIDQLTKDQSYFKDYTINEYTKSFTADEVQKLVDYFNTKLMQMMIKSKIERKEIKMEEINDIIGKSSPEDKKAIENFSSSYLSQRYSRFQDHLNSTLNKMIYERTQQVLLAIFKSIPEIVKTVEVQG